MATLVFIQLALEQPARSANKSDDLELIYDADSRLCGKLVEVLNRLHEKYPKARDLRQVSDALYHRTGIGQPRRLKSSDPALSEFPEHGSGWFFRRDAASDGKQRLVFVRDWMRGSRGDYTTEIWIFKPGMGYREKRALDSGMNRVVTDVDPDVVDLRINFENRSGTWPFKYPWVRPPDQRFEFSNSSRSTEAAEKLVKVSFAGLLSQTPFTFDSRVYFFAGSPLDGGTLIYRVTPTLTAQAVCLAITPNSLTQLRSSGFLK